MFTNIFLLVDKLRTRLNLKSSLSSSHPVNHLLITHSATYICRQGKWNDFQKGIKDFFFTNFIFIFPSHNLLWWQHTLVLWRKKGSLSQLLFLFLQPTIDFWQICPLNRKQIAVAELDLTEGNNAKLVTCLVLNNWTQNVKIIVVIFFDRKRMCPLSRP
jgi:hypothetical protein